MASSDSLASPSLVPEALSLFQRSCTSFYQTIPQLPPFHASRAKLALQRLQALVPFIDKLAPKTGAIILFQS